MIRILNQLTCFDLFSTFYIWYHMSYYFAIEKCVNSEFPHMLFLTLSQTTNFRLFKTERGCRRQIQIWLKWRKVLHIGRKQCGKKEKLLAPSNFSFSHSVFKRLLLQTRKNQGLFGKMLKWFACRSCFAILQEKMCNFHLRAIIAIIQK